MRTITLIFTFFSISAYYVLSASVVIGSDMIGYRCGKHHPFVVVVFPIIFIFSIVDGVNSSYRF